MRVPTVVVSALCFLGACNPGGPLELPPVDAAAAQKFQTDIHLFREQDQWVPAARALAQMEKGRLPESFRVALDNANVAEPDRRAEILADAVLAHDDLLAHACKNGKSLMLELVEVQGEARSRLVFDRCGGFNLAMPMQLPSTDPMALLYALVAHAHLSRGGELHEGESFALELLAVRPPPS